MDKHDRPYKCLQRGCEKLQGFTYSGGLLRHEREVHKMHGGARKPLFCPYPDCKRSSGDGFTRKENLQEHIRRVHRRSSTADGVPIEGAEGEISQVDIPTQVIEMEIAENNGEPGAPPRMVAKRKRISMDSGRSPEDPDATEEESDLRSEVKRLRTENLVKDDRIKTLERDMEESREEMRKLTAMVEEMQRKQALV